MSLAVLAMSLLVLATCFSGTHAKLWSSRSADSQPHWTHLGPAPLDTTHSVILALKENNMDQLEQMFHDIHDPSHPSWLQHMTPQQIHDITAPPAEHTDAMIEWLVSGGVSASSIEYGLGTGAIQFIASVGTINGLFNTTMAVYQHTKQLIMALAHDGDCHLPDQFADMIEFADGLHFLPIHVQRHGQILEYDDWPTLPVTTSTNTDTNTTAASRHLLQSGYFYPLYPANSLYSWYNAPDQAGYTKDSSATAITNVEVVQFWTSDNHGDRTQNSYSPVDLYIYSYLWSNNRNTGTLSIDNVIGPNNANNPTGEPSLDVQSITAFYPQSSAVFENQVSNRTQMYGFATNLFARTNIPQVVSISYGLAEVVYITGGSATIDGIPANTYLDRANQQFMKIGLRGTTVIASSGDDGANSEQNPACDYSSGFQFYGFGLLVDFPASSPYVTAVGGTAINDQTASHFTSTMDGGALMCNNFGTSKYSDYMLNPVATNATREYRCFQSGGSVSRTSLREIAVSLENSNINSGGGFSRQFPLPSWQAAAVNGYVNSHPTGMPPSSYFNASMRAVPDVALYGAPFPVIIGRTFTQESGTSLAAPLFAAVIAQLNAVTRAATGQTLGFVNPLLYQMQAAQSNTFYDITTGNNNCPRNPSQWDTQAECRAAGCQGFPAATGYDAVTGLGVPNVNNMISYVTQLVKNGQFSGHNDTGSVTNISSATAGVHYSTGGFKSAAGSTQPMMTFILVLAMAIAIVMA